MRQIGASGIGVSEIGFGAWAIGGPAFSNGSPVGWGVVDDDESVAAIGAALDAGINFIDTAPGYGAGHSERVIGRALASRRDEVVIGTKFGVLIDEANQSHIRQEASPDSIRQQCDDSLARLGTDRIDLYQFHLNTYDLAGADDVVAALEGLVDAGKVRTFGWSTDDPERIARFAKSPNCQAAQVRYNVVEGSDEVREVVERLGLAGVIRSPLAMGVLTGKFTTETTFAENDVRGAMFDLRHGRQARALEAVGRVREILTANGRTAAQGALCWLLAKSPAFVPIPGIRTVAQAKENAGAIAHGPLSTAEMDEIDSALADLAAP